jgi:hypothetical protein
VREFGGKALQRPRRDCFPRRIGVQGRVSPFFGFKTLFPVDKP